MLKIFIIIGSVYLILSCGSDNSNNTKKKNSKILVCYDEYGNKWYPKGPETIDIFIGECKLENKTEN